MNERAKITTSHLSRQAIVYLRQSSAAQVENNRESTDRQYALAAKARELGWPADRIVVIDEDLGLSGSGFVARSGFARLTAEVALARVGLVLGLEVSRLARNNADWHRLIELGGLTDTLIGDADGIYHPALFNDRQGRSGLAATAGDHGQGSPLSPLLANLYMRRFVLGWKMTARAGGRAWTCDVAGLRLDLGCGWLHSANRNPWTRIDEAAGFAVDRRTPAWGRQYRDLGFSQTEQAAANQAFAAWSSVWRRPRPRATARPDVFGEDRPGPYRLPAIKEKHAAPLVSRLGRACLPTTIVGFFHGAVQPHPDQMQHAPINDPTRYRLQKLGMGNAPEVVREVGVHHFRMAAKQQLLHLDHRLLSVSPGAVGIEFRWKVGFEDRLQHQHCCCHADPIPQG